MSFRQFQRCTVCNVNHNKGQSHIYSKKHVELVKKALDKFRDKVKSVISKCQTDKFEFVMKNSQTSAELDTKFWCYFCEDEFLKNSQEDFYILLNWDFIEHLSKTDHKEKFLAFKKTNRLKIIDFSYYFILEKDFQSLKDKKTKEENEFKISCGLSMAKEAEMIRTVEKSRGNILWSVKMNDLRIKRLHYKASQMMNKNSQHSCSIANSTTNSIGYNINSSSCNVMNANSNNFSDISHKNVSSDVIGPTKDDLLLHKYEEERRKKRLLPKIRTNLSSTMSQTLHNKIWLPYKVRRSMTRKRPVNHISADIKYDYIKSKFVFKPNEQFNMQNNLSSTSSSSSYPSKPLSSLSFFPSSSLPAGHSSTPTSFQSSSSSSFNGHHYHSNSSQLAVKPYVSKRKMLKH
ncbi:hypothetical protein HELRODRAFT_175213 [Helobdella robusta]|uniref:Uncharacterized protein n=1 Tax=Helobdella robusta TaxID=6412 RepID=T1F908_HELRO|nr:hypothetical protein HELRODRAFT_175213 [Helobdella robusta]ESO01185.1 hypothetical protein HELRODRAFT_175213 [Helobdella robusta]